MKHCTSKKIESLINCDKTPEIKGLNEKKNYIVPWTCQDFMETSISLQTFHIFNIRNYLHEAYFPHLCCYWPSTVMQSCFHPVIDNTGNLQTTRINWTL